MRKIIITLVLLNIVFLGFASNYDKERVYSIGEEISEGVALSIVIGLATADEDLKYEISRIRDEFTHQNYTWLLIRSAIDIQSKTLNNMHITFWLALEVNPSDGVVIGTVKRMMLDGEKNEYLSLMNNKMFVETEEGTVQVALKNGKIKYLE